MYILLICINLFINFFILCSSDSRSCNRIYMEDLNEGTFSHINFPFHYTDQLLCPISIRVPNFQSSDRPVICLKFFRFKMPYSEGCSNDYLEIYGVGKFCGDGTLNGLAPTFDPLSNLFSESFCVSVKTGENFEMVYQSMFNSSDLGFFASFSFKNLDDGEDDDTNFAPDKSLVSPCNSETMFTCFNRQCINKLKVCDANEDCSDFSDETPTHANCLDIINKGPQTIELCNFEKDYCMFNQTGWYRSKTALPFPLYDNTLRNNEGYFMFTDASDIPASLTYTKYPITPGRDIMRANVYCLSFWYYMDRYVGRLVVYLAGQDLVRTAVMVKDESQGSQWNQAEIIIEDKFFPLTEVTFEVDHSMQSNIRDNVAIDDISLQPGTCVNNAATCMFELDICGWRHFISGDLKLSARWERNYGPDPNPNTGPLTDRFAKKGHYLLMNSKKYNRGDKARIISHPLSITSGSGTVCLEFWYMVYGSNMGSLKVISIDSQKRERSLWTDPGRNMRIWVYAFVHVSTDGVFQLMFEGIAGQTERSDLAIDDITVTPGYCQSKQANGNAPGNRPTINPIYPMYPPVNQANNTFCLGNQFRCLSGDECLSSYEVCDRIPQCFDRSDEAGCPQTGGPLYYHNQPSMNLGSIVGVSLASVGILVITLSLLFFFLTRRRMLRHNNAIRFSFHVLDRFDPSMYSGIPKPPTYQDVVDGETIVTKPPPYSDQPPPPYKLTTSIRDLQSSVV